MRKVLLVGLVLSVWACQKEEENNLVSDKSFDLQETVILDGQELKLNYKLVNSERQYEQNAITEKLHKLREANEMVYMMDGEINQPLLFSNKEMADKFVENNSLRGELNAKYGSMELESAEVPEELAAKGNAYRYFGISRADKLRAPYYAINMGYTGTNVKWSTRHLLRNTCETGGINFDNEISSITVSPGLEVVLYEDPDYSGSVLWLRAFTQTVYIDNLNKLKKQYTVIEDDYLLNGQICGFACTSWNDKITSISAYPAGGSQYNIPYNTCPQ